MVAVRGVALGAQNTSTSTSYVMPVPAETVDGSDVLVGVLAVQNATVPPAQTGWTLWTTHTTTALAVGIYRRNAVAEPASYTFTGLTSARYTGFVVAFSEVDLTTPQDVTPVKSSGGTTAQSFAAISPVTAGAWVLSVPVVSEAVTSTTWTAGNTTLDASRNSAATGSLTNVFTALGHVERAAVGSFTPTGPTASGTKVRTIQVSLALRPAVDTGPALLDRATTDAADTTDAAVPSVDLARGESDAADTADSVVAATAKAPVERAESDTADTADTLAVRLARPRATANAAQAVDSVARTRVGGRATSDLADTADAVAATFGRSRTTSDLADTTDTVAKRLAAVRGAPDTAPAVHSGVRTLASVRSTANGAPAADGDARTAATGRSVSDGAVTVDATTAGTPPPVRSSTEFSPAVDTTAKRVAWVRSRTDAAPAVDVPVAARALFRADVTAERVGTGDAVARGVGRSRTVTDAALAVDAVTWKLARGFLRSLTDQARALDVAARKLTQSRVATHDATTVDAVARSVWGARPVVESAALVDLVARATAAARELLDAAPAVDTEPVAEVVLRPRRGLVLRTGPVARRDTLAGPVSASTRTGPATVGAVSGQTVAGPSV